MDGYNIETQDGVIQVKPKFPTITTSLITNAGNYSSPLLRTRALINTVFEW